MLLSVCENNIHRLGAALELYGKDNDGHYPASITIENISPYFSSYKLKKLPECPCTEESYGYISSEGQNNFTIYCIKEKAHITTGIVATEGCWPQYLPGKGVLLKP